MDTSIRRINRSLTARVACIALVAGSAQAQSAPAGLRVASPDGYNNVPVEIRGGNLYYSLQRKGRAPLQMAADLPENYEKQPAFQFIRDVAVDWDESRVLEGKIGDYVVVARKQRNGPEWFIGAITDEEGRTLFDVPLSFLAPGRSYVAEVNADGPGAHWLTNPLRVAISRRTVTRSSNLRLVLAPGGGQAIRIRPAR